MNEPQKIFVEQIRRGSLSEELVDRLRQLIVEGELEPGSKVNEQAICDRFGVSRTPLREALRALASEGLVTLTPRRGATVSAFTVEDLEQTFPIVGALEALAGELACAQISDPEIALARALTGDLIESHSRRDLAGYAKANGEIHRLIMDAARNPTLDQMLQSLNVRVRRARVLVNISAARWATAVEEHREILAALEARDGARLGLVLKQHIANKLSSLRAQLEEQAGSQKRAATR